MNAKTYDPACYDLALAFLSDVSDATAEQCDELAALIQQTVEDFIQYGRWRDPALTATDGDRRGKCKSCKRSFDPPTSQCPTCGEPLDFPSALAATDRGGS